MEDIICKHIYGSSKYSQFDSHFALHKMLSVHTIIKRKFTRQQHEQKKYHNISVLSYVQKIGRVKRLNRLMGSQPSPFLLLVLQWQHTYEQ